MIYSIYENGWVAGETLHGGDYYLEIVYPSLFSKVRHVCSSMLIPTL